MLEWSAAQSSAPPRALGDSRFVSLPRPVSEAMLRRGTQQRRNRLKGSNPNEKPSVEELMAAFSVYPGIKMQRLRRLLPGDLPFYGGAGVLDDFILLADEPSVIQAFAAYWGPLGICRHLKPWTHSVWRSLSMSVQPTCCPLGARLAKDARVGSQSPNGLITLGRPGLSSTKRSSSRALRAPAPLAPASVRSSD